MSLSKRKGERTEDDTEEMQMENLKRLELEGKKKITTCDRHMYKLLWKEKKST